jgi:regulatory protein
MARHVPYADVQNWVRLWQEHGVRPEKSRRPLPPLTSETLDSLALRYVERFATSEARLTRYLERKLHERGWGGTGQPPVAAIVERLAALRYVDDRGFGEARARGLQRRGYGARRIGDDLRAAGIDAALRTEITATVDAREAAMTFARRRRFGPFGPPVSDPRQRQRQFAAMLRAGHDARIAAAILGAPHEADLYDD